MNVENSKRRPIYCVVILHYLSMDETIKCINSINKIKNCNNVNIIVVDNNSPNHSGDELINRYIEEDDVTILKISKNIGFAKANNIGYQYCIQKFSPDYVVIVNNDIEFYQPDFFERIDTLYCKKEFSVLGPDVYNTTENIHQNPLRKKGYSIKEIKKSILLRKYIVAVNKKQILALTTYKLLKAIKRNNKQNNTDRSPNAEGFQNTQDNVVLYGACLIFSKTFISSHNFAFCPLTFMYYEEEFLWYMLQKTKELILYSPLLSINHRHNGSTKEAFPNDNERIIFKELCAIESGNKLIEYISDGCKDFQEYSTYQEIDEGLSQ